MLRSSRQLYLNIKSSIKFPEKFKGTIIEKWADYWKNLVIDYNQMLRDLRTDIQDNPRKAFKWTTGVIGVYILAVNNPSETDFKDQLRKCWNDMILVSEDCRNPKSLEHLRFIQTCYNQNVIHYSSFGVISFMYTTPFNDTCSLYKSQCSYLQPSYLTYPSKVIDVGFMGRWWNIFAKTTDYDVNM